MHSPASSSAVDRLDPTLISAANVAEFERGAAQMTSPTVQRRRRRRVLALATAGLALCIGVSVTSLAAWQQDIDVTSGANGIGSSLLKIELSIDGGVNWTTASVSTSGTLSFSGTPTLLTPGDTVYASVLLRAAVGSRGANVALSGGAVTGTLISALTYAAKSNVPFLSCNANSFPNVGTALVNLNSALTSGSNGTTFSLPAATSSAPGTEVGVCLGISLPSGVATTLGGLSTSPVWAFNATSN